ncbi:uncharacterized protein B0H18DRAFT_1116363 [Fomitopsis serialis]|uniref:uncharacterized protein n=1 Tax=Fomitopsis serialis TaxID=139415 RepID=UPI00200724FE|nr:uncharacterized protein B0H18DRAFT_1116363 [Neoantrodia serialis]KAH9931584.1 hypothetical protein B0H18DRAFT_1116363 [Neoantrodia serialis]
MFPLIEDEGRTEYPFPPVPSTAMDAVEPSSSSSDTLPSAPSRIGSRSSRSSPAPPHAPRDRDYAYDREHSWGGTGGKAKLLARLMTRSERDANHYRSMLMLANERLEHETRRADDAEQRAIDTLQRLRQTREQAAQAQADTARANEETRLWKLRLEEAQREILRAQEIVDRLEQDKLDAEAEAARARTVARRLREEKVISRAREEGHRQGFQEGLSKGREMTYYEARAAGIASRNEPRRYIQRPAVVDDMSDEEEQEENATGSGSQPEEIIPITRSPPPQSWRPPSRSAETRSSMRSPPREPTSPIRVRSPRIAAPSPIHPNVPPPATTPNPIPVPDPSAGRSQSRHDDTVHPISVHNAVPSPSHPPVEIPPDNWIPYMSSDNVIGLPPPHELTKPLSPRASSPSLIDTTMRVPASSTAVYEQPVRSRDYAYIAGAGPSQPHGSAFSPLSKASTAISQYEIVSSRGERERSMSHGRSRSDVLAGLREMIGSPSGRSKTPSRQTREDSPRGPRPKEEPFTEVPDLARSQIPARSRTPARSKTPARPETPGRVDTSGGKPSALDRLFKKKWRNRTSTSSGVPDIQVESPSTNDVSPATSAGTISQPHMLSPETSHTDLPSLEVVHNYIDPALMESKDKRGLPSLPGADFAAPGDVPVMQEGQLPPGFVAFTSSIPQPGFPSRSNTPYAPMYSDADPSTSSRTDSTRSRTTSSSRRSAGTAKPATPKPRSGPAYEEAPLPPGMFYPAPPGRGPTPGVAAGVPLPPSPPRSATPRARRGSISSALSPLAIPQLLSDLRTPL